MTLDLPLIWTGILALAVFMYVLLDGFDLGIGILFPLAASPAERDLMMDSVAPIWDGNETWLVLGGGGLLAAFPAAYATLLPALYIPLIVMLLALILRGVAFEFRVRGRRRGRPFWTAAFAAGSLVATLCQGLVLGGFVQGVAVRHPASADGAFAWLSPYSVLTSLGLVAGYALLGASWLVWRTEGPLHARARRWTSAAALATGASLAAVSLATLFVQTRVAARWGFGGAGFDLAELAPKLPIPLLGLAGLALVFAGLRRAWDAAPFPGAMLVFVSGYLGLAASLFPYVAPYVLTFRQAAGPDNALALLLGGTAILLPLILAYTVWVYWVFRGKLAGDAGYH